MTSHSMILCEECVNVMNYLRQKKGIRNSFYPCSACGNTFTRKYNSRTHKRTIHGKRMYFVCHCGNGFTRKDSLIRHQRTLHPTPLDTEVVGKSVSVPYDAASVSTQTQDDGKNVTQSSKQVLITIRSNDDVNTDIQIV